MSSNSMERDHPEVPPLTAEPSGRVEWPRLLARVVEGVVRAELHQFEENLIAFLNSAVASAYESFIWITAQVIGAAFLLTAFDHVTRNLASMVGSFRVSRCNGR